VSFTPKKLLIVEDDPDMVAWIDATLSSDFLELHFAANGVEAVAQARRLKPDALLLDVDLPGMDGFDVFRTLRRELAPRPPAAVFFSAVASPGAFGLALDLGAFACVRKPCSPTTLRKKVFAAAGITVEWPSATPQWDIQFEEKPRRGPGETEEL
jgi:CheY-like chemotaxis protein